MATEDRGFASMDRDKQREIASKGGRAAHKIGAAHEWTREEAQAARDGGADFVVFGPIFSTESKLAFGPPQGLNKLRDVTRALDDFPVLAIGGITLDNIAACLSAGASGVAGITIFNNFLALRNVL